LNSTPIWSREHTNKPDTPLMISALLIGGPYGGRVSSASPGRQHLFVCQPIDAHDESACATKILSTLARRAYRRPPTSEEVATLAGFSRGARRDENFEPGVRAGVGGVLMSPDFLFRIEADPAGAAPGTVYALPDLELASRLSFFLWSSIPDDELLET